MENPVPKPDPIIIKPVIPVMPVSQIDSLPFTLLEKEKDSNSLKRFFRKNKKLVGAILLFLLALCIAITLLIINSNQTSKNTTPVTVVSKPISTSTVTQTPATPTSISDKTLEFSIDNSHIINNKPFNTLTGSIVVKDDVSFSNPSPDKGVFKEGTSSLTITSAVIDTDLKLIDATSIGITKTLGDTYRISKVGNFEGQVLYYYVNKNDIKFTGTCSPVSYSGTVNAPCGYASYKGYYFQCTGNNSFDFCDKIISDLEFTITSN